FGCGGHDIGSIRKDTKLSPDPQITVDDGSGLWQTMAFKNFSDLGDTIGNRVRVLTQTLGGGHLAAIARRQRPPQLPEAWTEFRQRLFKGKRVILVVCFIRQGDLSKELGVFIRVKGLERIDWNGFGKGVRLRIFRA